MEQNAKKSINFYMRSLHRDIGFFLIGLTLIYCISGIILVYRDTTFLKHEEKIEKKLSPNLSETEIGGALHIKNFEVVRSEGNVVYFKNGVYNKTTGVANYTSQEFPAWLKVFNKLHMTSSKDSVHIFAVLFGVLLLFLAISSFWMFKPHTKNFSRGIYLAVAGIVFAVVILIL